jgi:hypothetical protein
MKYIFTALFLIFSVRAFSQDSLHTKPFDMYWTKPRIVPRAGIAIQESTSVEAGITYHKIYVHPVVLSSISKYLTAEMIIRDNHFVAGPKVGYEFTVGLLGLASDFTYYTDGHIGSPVLTPKMGLSIYGFVNVLYGYNILLSNDTFNYISKTRLSISVNLNRDYGNLNDAPRK